MLDLLIRNGTVVDGTGAPARRADVSISDGKIAAVGRASQSARRTIDADGLVVAPGFIDPHTHYDAQICWDGALTPSSWHGVTSVVMGNCGVGIAPCRPAAREIAMRDLVNVEAIPFEVLDAGITWDWESFPQYLDAATRRRPALNLAFLAPLTPFPPLSPDGSRSFPRKELSRGVGEWNHYYVRAINGELRLWVNGEEVSGGSGAQPRTGYLCLESEGSPVEFKNIRVRELP